MEFSSSYQDKLKWNEFHTPSSAASLMNMKNMMQDELIKALDELTKSVLSSNNENRYKN